MSDLPIVGARIGRARSFLRKATQYIIEANYRAWFAPGQPLRPVAPPEQIGRRLDYPIATNINLVPRSGEQVSFGELRALAEYHDVTRLLIETRKDQMEALPWTIKIRTDTDSKTEATAEQKERIEQAIRFFEKPDGVHPFGTWMRMLLEDVLVIDAPTCFVDRTEPLSTKFAVIDGATIKPLIDPWGKLPEAPEPAYQQNIKGMPAWDYTKEELIYMPRNPRPNHIYGMPPVQQIIVVVNIALRRQASQLEYYTEGNVPDALIGTPKEWSAQQIIDYQQAWDAMNAGNTAERRRAKFVPGEAKVQFTRDVTLKDEFDEWLARVACYAFSIAPMAFVKEMNRATAQTAKKAAEEEGLAPLMRWAKQLVDECLQKHLGQTDLEFAYVEDLEEEPDIKVDLLDKQLRAGAITLNEYREEMGRDPYGEEGDVPMVYMGPQPVPLKQLLEPPAPPPAPLGGPASPGGEGNQPPKLGPDGKPLAPDQQGKQPVADDKQAEEGDDKQAKEEKPAAKARTRRQQLVKREELRKQAQGRSLYIHRPLLNAQDLIDWAKEQGFETTLPASSMHVTIAYSKEPVLWDTLRTAASKVTASPTGRQLLQFDEGAVVIRFTSMQLADRWQELCDSGCAWKWPSYEPHVTLTYKMGNVDITTMKPYDGPLVFGPEEWEEIDGPFDPASVKEAAAQ